MARRLLAVLATLNTTVAVLRYPDGSFESRFPLHVDECGSAPLGPDSADCLSHLRRHLLEDGDCNRVICDNIASSTPVEVYANRSDWAPFKNLCGNLKELFQGTFDLGVDLLGRQPGPSDEQRLAEIWSSFSAASPNWLDVKDEAGTPAYANSSLSVIRRHAREVFELFGKPPVVSADALLDLASAIARRMQLMIENFSVTLLLNFHVAQLEHSGRAERGADLVSELYGDVDSVRVRFHEVPGKRWDTLTHLLDRLGVSARPVAMAEIGVEAANTSQRLLERNPLLSYVGVDPYVNNDGLHADVVRRLTPYMESGRFELHRSISLSAADRVPDASMDLVFLDARHDYEAVAQDIEAWRPKVRPGGILSGHDYSWMFPTVAMAVYKAAFSTPEATIHLAPDGVWWFQL